MKKITFLMVFLIGSIVHSQSFQGTWKVSPQAGALGVGPNQGDISWWSNGTGDVTTRACFFDDEYIFNADGSFHNNLGSQSWIEGWQGGSDACGTPVAPHNGVNAATWSYDSTANTITLTGVGAYLGIPKATNSGELSSPSAAPASVTYKVTTLTSATATLDINFGGGWWRFIMQKQGVAPSCTDGIQNGTETGIDCGGTCSNPCLTQINLPVTFEGSTTDFTLTDFGGTVSTKVADPTNPNNMVIKTIKTAGAAGWAGTTVGTSTGFSSPVPFSSTNKKMYVKVLSPSAGIIVRLKVEDHTNVNNYVEQDVTTTVAGWQTLEFDFTNPATAAFNSSFVYDKASIFFDFIPAVNNAVDQTFYFDDMSFGQALKLNDFELNGMVKIYPNPSRGSVTINSLKTIENVSVTDVLGHQVFVKNANSDTVTFDLSNLQNGVYFIQTTVNGKIATSRFIKE